MKIPPIPKNERARVSALEQYAIVDTPREASFDAITMLAASVADAPIAMVSIVDASRQWCKSCHGLELTETPRASSFCGHVVIDGGPLIVNDARADRRFMENPFVTGTPFIRFYAGMPLVTAEGFVLGTLAVIDRQPRELVPRQSDALTLLAGQTVALLELRRQSLRLAAQSDALANREQELQAILDTAVDAIITIDRDGLIAGVNPAVQRLFGYAPSELIGRNVSVLMPSPDRELHDGYLAAYERTGHRKVIGIGREVSARRKDGSTFPADLAVSELNLRGSRGFTGVIRDLSERKRIERLESEFVSTVSHELRTPLTSVRGALGLIAGGVTGELPSQAKAYVDIALSNTERLVRLINDILDLEKIESGNLEIRWQVCKLAGLLEQVIAANDAFGGSYQVTLALLDDIPDVDVVVDEDRFNQVLTNLISNAVKFSPAGRAVELSVVMRGARVRVNVRDYGSGIPEEFCGRIFQRFAQADGSDRRRKGGTGLGLSIAKSLIEGMRGEIGFEAPEGGGTRFFVDLPWLPPVEETAAADAALMLVCEDDLDVARTLQGILERAGGSVHVAPTLDRARQLLAKFQYRILTLDLMLADGDGSVLIAEARANPATADVPIVVVSGLSAPTAHARLGVTGMLVADVLPKPIDESHLLEAARNACKLARRQPGRVLCIEADVLARERVRASLSAACDLTVVDVADAASLLPFRPFDVVMVDLAALEGGALPLELLGSAQVIVFSAGDPAPAVARRLSRALLEAHGAEAELGAVLAELNARRASAAAST
jgi:PAS domain S-box-containing protein